MEKEANFDFKSDLTSSDETWSLTSSTTRYNNKNARLNSAILKTF